MLCPLINIEAKAYLIKKILFSFPILLVIGVFWFNHDIPSVHAAAITNVINAATDTEVSATTTHQINFTTYTSVPANGKILITFPNGFNVSGATFNAWSGFDGGQSITTSFQTVTITRDGAGAVSTAGLKYIKLDNIVNTSSAGTTYTVTVETQDSSGTSLDGPVVSSYFSICTHACHTLTSHIASSSLVSSTTEHTTNFTTASSTPANGKIKLTFPSGFDVSSASTTQLVNGTTAFPFTQSINGQTITITNASTSAMATGSSYVVINNIVNASVASTSYYVIIETTDASDTNIEGPNSIRFSIDDAVRKDSFDGSSGISASSNAAVNAAKGAVELTPTGSPPYNTSGYVITTTILPELWAQWSQIYWTADLPTGTSLKIQFLDSAGYLVSDDYLPGNSSGFSQSPVDISPVAFWHTSGPCYDRDMNIAYSPCLGKILQMKIKVILETTDTSQTPSLTSLTLSWTPTQGTLSASPLASTSWPVAWKKDNQGTKHADYAGPDYPAYKWVLFTEDDFMGGGAVAPDGNLIVKTQGSGVADIYGHFYSLDRDTGAINWQLNYPGAAFSGVDFSIAQNGTIYYGDIFQDVFMALDSSDGSVKWSHNYGSGHSLGTSVISPSGTVFHLKYNSTSKIYAYNPDGSEKWTYTINLGAAHQTNSVALSADSNYLLVSSCTFDSGYAYEGLGKIQAFDVDTGNLEWSYDYPGGSDFMDFIVDQSGNIYAPTYTAGGDFLLISLTSSGSLRWSKDLNNEFSIGPMNVEWLTLTVGSQILYNHDRGYDDVYERTSLMFAFERSNGQTAWSQSITPFWENGYTSNSYGFITDALGNSYANILNYADDLSTWFYENVSYDSTGNMRWKVKRPQESFDLNPLLIDEYGYIYLCGGNYFSHSTTSAIAALQPWTITASVNPSGIYTVGETITFTAVSSMLQADPFSAEANQVQAYLSDGTAVPLAYSSTDSNDNTVWTGTYQVPAGTGTGIYTATIEAATVNVETDTQVHFTSPPTSSNNTGITTAVNYTIQLGGIAIPPIAFTPPSQPSPTPENPQGEFKFLINEGADTTDTRTVNLELFAGSDTARMSISNYPDFREAGQEPYNSTKTWTLLEGAGEKTIYVKFYTQYGQPSEVVSYSIFLKTTETAQPETITVGKIAIENIKTQIADVKQQLIQTITQLIQLIQSQIKELQNQLLELTG